MNQFQTGIECRLNVIPKVNHRVELEHPPAINCLKVVVIQKIEDDVLAQTWANQPWQTNNQVVREMLFDECLQQSTMQTIGMQARFIDRGVLVNTYGILKDIHRTDQNKGFALNGFKVCDQLLNFLSIRFWLPVGDPLLRRSTCTHYRIK